SGLANTHHTAGVKGSGSSTSSMSVFPFRAFQLNGHQRHQTCDLLVYSPVRPELMEHSFVFEKTAEKAYSFIKPEACRTFVKHVVSGSAGPRSAPSFSSAYDINHPRSRELIPIPTSDVLDAIVFCSVPATA
ncbi:hypothetical protein KUCAC02_001082, partial [Chaenocephalus aceratus]